MKEKRSYLFLLLLSLLFVQLSIAQEKQLLKHKHLWNTAIGDIQIKEKWFFNSEVHVRFTDVCSEFQQYLFIPGIKYNYKPHISFSSGFTYFKNLPHGNAPLPIAQSEITLWQQTTLKHKTHQFSFFHRLRMEERFTQKLITGENGDTWIDGRVYNNRFRYRCLVNRPITKSKKVYLMSFNEIWLNIPSKSLEVSLNQNLFYLGTYYKFRNGVRLGIGGMHQYLNRGKTLVESNLMLSFLCLYKIGKGN